MAGHPAAKWARRSGLSAIHVDCVTAVMLKILDGKCKMSAPEKEIMAIVYDTVKHRRGALLEPGIHALIAETRNNGRNADVLAAVYEQRVLAETMISRPVMKSFKAMLRSAGVIPA